MGEMILTTAPPGKYSRTNPRTIEDRVKIIREILPKTKSIGEICCGDCRLQNETYARELGARYIGLDFDEKITELLQANKVACELGDALDPAVLGKLTGCDLLFFGPPLSFDCTGHVFFRFDQVLPSYQDFLKLIFGKLKYGRTVVCITPKTTRMGEIRALYDKVREEIADLRLPRVHLSFSDMTGRGSATEPRLKYIELWFSRELPDEWKVTPADKASLLN